MFLSKLALNPRLNQVRRDLANPYEMHRTLAWAIRNADGDERLLWRLEPGHPNAPILLVQTRALPRWDQLLERHADYAEPNEPLPMDAFLTRALQSGVRLRFRLRANASVKRLGKRHALNTNEEKTAWMTRQATANGFDLLDVTVVTDERVQARKAEALVTLDATLFDGYLRVVEPERARRALENGIGHAKGFGLGLLSIATVRA